MRKDITVEIKNFQVDESYYSFDYKIWINGKLEGHGEISDDHCWENLEDFKNMMLEENEAVKLTLEKL